MRGALRRVVHRIRRHDDPVATPIDTSPPETYWKYAHLSLLAQRYDFSDNLAGAELRVFSQNGEDGVLGEIMRRIGVEQRFFVEFGVGDGTQCNTRFLSEVLGWSGVYFEIDESDFERLQRRFAPRDDVATLQHAVTPENVNELFAAAGVPTELDVLSIDIDGQDYWVWKALDGYRPRVVIIEYNAAIPASERLVEPLGHRWDRSRYLGASIGAIEKLAAEKGYRLVYAELAGVNAFCVRDDLAGPFADERFVHRAPNVGLLGGGLWPYEGPSAYVEV